MIDYEKIRNDEMLNRIFTTLLAECYKHDNSLDVEERFKMTPNEVVDVLTEHYDSIFCNEDKADSDVNKRLDRIEFDIMNLKSRVNMQNYHDAHFI